jgi:hypothetical protein
MIRGLGGAGFFAPAHSLVVPWPERLKSGGGDGGGRGSGGGGLNAGAGSPAAAARTRPVVAAGPGSLRRTAASAESVSKGGGPGHYFDKSRAGPIYYYQYLVIKVETQGKLTGEGSSVSWTTCDLGCLLFRLECHAYHVPHIRQR